MSTIIPKLHIRHFKSIKDLTLDCDRINVFIGRPNAGKSNILEAISLLGEGYSGEKFMEGMIRYNSVFQLFNNFDTRKIVSIETDILDIELSKKGENYYFSIEPVQVRKERGKLKGFHDQIDFESFKTSFLLQYTLDDFENPIVSTEKDFINQSCEVIVGPNGIVTQRKRYGHNFSPVKRYEFHPQEDSDRSDLSFFLPPHGGNFYRIVRTSKALRQEIQNFLKPNGLELMLDEEKREVSVLQREEDTLVRLPLRLLPDTFQRYIFHLAAVMSNQQSVLLFEEPEVHAYGPYIYQLAQHILNDEGGNQYFITTHNPYFLIPLIQEGKDVAVFTTWFENYQTHARRLSETELSEILDYGVDVFLNLDHFIPA
ncbi:MAG: AAA family ATPase [Saprospiraceae bacterium]|nr:AAA family ATPase [Saprospiraceae bacterium]